MASVLALPLWVLLSGTVQAQLFTDRTYILAAPGQSAPGGTDTFENAGNFALANRGAVFSAYLSKAKQSVTYATSIAGTHEVLRPGTIIPGKGTILGTIDVIRTNRYLESALFVNLRGLDGVERDAIVAGDSVSSLRVVVVAGQTVTDKGYTLSSTYSMGINDQGQVGIQGLAPGGWGAFIGNPNGSVIEVARPGQQAPGSPYTFSSVGGVIGNFGQMMINSEVNSVSSNKYLVCRRNVLGNLVKIAAAGDPAPSTPYVFDWITGRGMNDSGEVVTYGYIRTPAGVWQGEAIFAGRDTASLRPIAYAGQAAPNGLGAFTSFDSSLSINRDGKVPFVGYYNGGCALIVADGDSRRVLAKTGDAAPGGGTFTGFAMSRMSDNGTVMFAASLNGSQGYPAIYLADGRDMLKVTKAGDQVSGRTLSEIGVDPAAYNDFQQVLYQARLSGTSGYSILAFAPRLRWRDPIGGAWDDFGRWTASLTPGEYNSVDILPDLGVQVTGPAEAVEVESLRIGAAVSGITDFKLSTGSITADAGVHVVAGGRLSGNGGIIGNVANASIVAPGNSPGQISISGDFSQDAAGTLSIEIAGAEQSQFDRVLVDGNVSLSGGLEIDLLNGAIDRISRGDRFTFLTSTGVVTGKFSSTGGGDRVATKDGLASFLVSYSGGQITLSDFSPLDSDGDGIPDYWMRTHFGSDTVAAGLAADDSDGDGVSNRNEYVAGTAPKDGSSALRAAVAVSEGAAGISVSFQSAAGRFYKLQHSPDLAPDSWVDVKTGIAGDGSVKTEQVSQGGLSGPAGFFRVVVER